MLLITLFNKTTKTYVTLVLQVKLILHVAMLNLCCMFLYLINVAY